MYCSTCGKEIIDDSALYCSRCGAQIKTGRQTSMPIQPAINNAEKITDNRTQLFEHKPKGNIIKCPRCNSENIQMQNRSGKGLPLIAFVLLFGGIGLMFFSVIGLVMGALLGCVIGAIVKAALPKKNETVAVCQSCGYTSEPIPQGLPSQNGHPLFSTDSECNLSITREISFTGSAIFLVVRIDNHKPFNISNGMTVNLKLENGPHKIVYEQGGGLGKQNRQGSVDLITEDGIRQHLRLTFTQSGLDVTKTW